MHKMTEDDLKVAFAGESQAHMKYLAFADRAEKEFPNIARLFRGIAFAELVHATKHLRNLGGVGSVTENLATAFEGETYEITEMYPAFKAVAELQGEKMALQGINWALEAEKTHARLYTDAKARADEGKDITLPTLHVCTVCGYTIDGEAPDKCPICNANKTSFRSF